MGVGYQRADVSNLIANGEVVDADVLDLEFNAVENAFNSSSGHTHDGTSAEGGPITKVGPTQDVVFTSNSITPKITNTVDFGSNSLKFKDAFFQGSVLSSGGFTGNLTGSVTGDLIGNVMGNVIGDVTGNADTVTNGVYTSRTINVSGLVTGGGDLSADRTITVTEATQEEAEAGVASNVVSTPRRVADAINSRLIKYESAEIVLSSSGTSSVSHGLGGQPNFVNAVLVCKTAEGSFSVGDEVHQVNSWVDGTTVVNFYISATDTNLTLHMVTDTSPLTVPPSISIPVTPANWRIILRAVRFG